MTDLGLFKSDEKILLFNFISREENINWNFIGYPTARDSIERTTEIRETHATPPTGIHTYTHHMIGNNKPKN